MCGNHVLLLLFLPLNHINLETTSRCLGILVGKMWNGATLIWSLAIATWFPAVSFVEFLAPKFWDLVICQRIEVCIFLTSGWGSLVKGCGRFAGNFQQLISWSYLRYHQVTAHPGRSINVHVWHGTPNNPLAPCYYIYISSLNLTAISPKTCWLESINFSFWVLDGLCFFSRC